MEQNDDGGVVRLVSRREAVQEGLHTDIVETLEELLLAAQKGELTSLVVVCSHRDGSWSHEQSGVLDIAGAIGRLEIVQQDWINCYLREVKESPHGA